MHPVSMLDPNLYSLFKTLHNLNSAIINSTLHGDTDITSVLRCRSGTVGYKRGKSLKNIQINKRALLKKNQVQSKQNNIDGCWK